MRVLVRDCFVFSTLHVVCKIYVMMLSYTLKMRTIDLAKKRFYSVRCPTCGVAAGHRCILKAGALRLEPHKDRKLSAASEAVARKLRARR